MGTHGALGPGRPSPFPAHCESAMISPGEVTARQAAAKSGDRTSLDGVIALVHKELPVAAHHQIVRARPGETLNTTALLNEPYLKLAASSSTSFAGRRLNVRRRSMLQEPQTERRRAQILRPRRASERRGLVRYEQQALVPGIDPAGPSSGVTQTRGGVWGKIPSGIAERFAIS